MRKRKPYLYAGTVSGAVKFLERRLKEYKKLKKVKLRKPKLRRRKR